MEAPNDPYQQPDAAATSDPAAFHGEEFTLLDSDSRPSSSAAEQLPDNLTDGFGASVSSVSAGTRLRAGLEQCSSGHRAVLLGTPGT